MLDFVSSARGVSPLQMNYACIKSSLGQGVHVGKWVCKASRAAPRNMGCSMGKGQRGCCWLGAGQGGQASEKSANFVSTGAER